MIRKVKVLSLITAALFTVSSLAACGSKPAAPAAGGSTNEPAKSEAPAAPKKNVTLKMWGGVPPEAGPQAACDMFNKEFEAKGIKIEYERFVNDDQGNLKLDTNLLAGSDIDIYVTYSLDTLRKRATGNMAMDLTEFLKKENIDIKTKFSKAAALTAIENKFYAIPSTKGNAHALILNKNMFDAAGIPIPTAWTFDEFRDIAKKLTKGEGQNKVYGFFGNSGQDMTFPNAWAQAALGDDYQFVPESKFKETRYTDPVFQKAYQTITDMMLVDKTAVPHVDSVTQKLTIESVFLAEKAAISVGPWVIRSIKDREKFPHKFVTAFAPFPVADKSKYYPPVNAGDLISINPKSKNINEAWEFIKWYTDKGILEVAKGGRVPGSTSINPDATTKAILDGAEDLLDAKSFKGVLIDHSAEWALINYIAPPEMSKVAKEEIEAMYLGKKQVKDGLADMKKRSDEILKTAK